VGFEPAVEVLQTSARSSPEFVRLPSRRSPGAAPSRSPANLGMDYPGSGLPTCELPAPSASPWAAESTPQRRQLRADDCCDHQSWAALHRVHIRAA